MDHGIVLVPSDGQNNKRKKWGRLVGVLEARRQWTVYKSAAVTAHVAPRIMIERCRVVTPWRDAAAAFNDLPLSLSLSLPPCTLYPSTYTPACHVMVRPPLSTT